MTKTSENILVVARMIAERAKSEGVLDERVSARVVCEHMGAVLADSILQSGLNYESVVKPRVLNILSNYPEANCLSSIKRLIHDRALPSFLNWEHSTKIQRFESLVVCLDELNIECVSNLREGFRSDLFCNHLQTVKGIGPKTVDYMACLVGIDSIAVDRHVRTYAKRTGIDNEDYQFLKKVFSYAADLLALSRRDFDAWVWKREATGGKVQLGLQF